MPWATSTRSWRSRDSHHAAVHSLGSSTVDNTSVTGSRITAHVKGLNIAATLWADSSNRLVQASVRATTHRSLGISAVVNFSGYGAPVTITVPPSSQVKAIPLSVVTTVLGGLLHHAHVARHGARGLTCLATGRRPADAQTRLTLQASPSKPAGPSTRLEFGRRVLSNAGVEE